MKSGDLRKSIQSPRPAGDQLFSLNEDNDIEAFEDNLDDQINFQEPTHHTISNTPLISHIEENKQTTPTQPKFHFKMGKSEKEIIQNLFLEVSIERKSSLIKVHESYSLKKPNQSHHSKTLSNSSQSIRMSQIPFNSEGTVPLDGSNPYIYSHTKYIQPNSFLRNSLEEQPKPPHMKDAYPPTFMSFAEVYYPQKSRPVLDGYEETQDGQLQFTDEETLNRQRGIINDVLKKITKSIFYSEIEGMSLPARGMSARSMTDKIADLLKTAPYYLSRASVTTNKLERLKLVISANVSSLHCSIEKLKVLNPLLGETFQGYLEDGTEIYVEQISHHPPISKFLVYGPNGNYKMSGSVTPIGRFGTNKAKIYMGVDYSIEFKDGYKINLVKFPQLKMPGLVTGARTIWWKGALEYHDSEGLKAFVFIDYSKSNGFWLFKKKSMKRDLLEGIIYLPKLLQNGQPFNTSTAKRISDLKDIKTEISKISGSWLKKLNFDAVNYWDIERFPAKKILFPSNPLPSDSRFREDLIWLRRNDFTQADLWKNALENQQRHDRKERSKNSNHSIS